ncbi:MAG: hypothetical protein WB543_06840 [Candidatus Acidiferrum sp.]
MATLLAAIVIIVAMHFFFGKRKKKSSEDNFRSTAEFVQCLAGEAINDARQHNHMQLDYSIESIQSVEKVLGGLHDQYSKNSSSMSVDDLASAYGAYIGEVIRRSEPGAKWERDDPVGGEKSYPIIWGGGHSYPMAWCYRRIVNGPEDNVWVKYQVLKDRRSKSPTPETR